MMPSSMHDTPAICGGPKAVTRDDAAANRWPVITAEDEAEVLRVLRDGDLSTHAVTRELEDDYRRFIGVKHALAHCNGSAALLAAFHAVGLRPGDEVIVPSATHWASVVPMLWLGALPVFCESERDRMGLDPEDVARRITPRTKAIVVVHLWGMPSRMTSLVDIAKQHGLAVIEDASHALGATWSGSYCGALGDIAVVSLQSSKLAPAGEGGVLLTNNDRFMERAVCLGDITRILELDSDARRLAATSFGIKTRMAPLSAAIARGQLRRLPDNNARRNRNIEYLSNALESLGFDTFLPPPHIRRVYFEFIVRPDPERVTIPIRRLVEALTAEGCDVSWPRYPLLHQQPLFTEGLLSEIARLPPGCPTPVYRADALPRTAEAGRAIIRLPTFPHADTRLLDQYIEAFQKMARHQNRIRN